MTGFTGVTVIVSSATTGAGGATTTGAGAVTTTGAGTGVTTGAGLVHAMVMVVTVLSITSGELLLDSTLPTTPLELVEETMTGVDVADEVEREPNPE